MPFPSALARVSSIALLCSALAATGQAATPPAEAAAGIAPLSLADCVQRALARNFDIELGHFDTANAAADVSIARAGFDPVFKASSTRSGSRLEGASSATYGWDNRAGLAQHTVTGADVSVSTGLDRTKHRLSNPYNPAYDSDVALTLSQPLLRGAGIAAARAAADPRRDPWDAADTP